MKPVRNTATLKTPMWHKTVLEERKEAVRTGKATYSDWTEARKRLGKKLLKAR